MKESREGERGGKAGNQEEMDKTRKELPPRGPVATPRTAQPKKHRAARMVETSREQTEVHTWMLLKCF